MILAHYEFHRTCAPGLSVASWFFIPSVAAPISKPTTQTRKCKVAHPAQRSFCESVKARFPAAFSGKRVLECGALNINGSCRELFSECEYLGIDVVPGKDVDKVVMCHEHKGQYDTIISCEMLEHDIHQFASIKNMVRMLASGGLMLTTCATTGRAEHGTLRTTPQDAPGLPWAFFYRNVSEEDMRWAIEDMSVFSEYAFSIGHQTSDLYFYGIKR